MSSFRTKDEFGAFLFKTISDVIYSVQDELNPGEMQSENIFSSSLATRDSSLYLLSEIIFSPYY